LLLPQKLKEKLLPETSTMLLELKEHLENLLLTMVLSTGTAPLSKELPGNKMLKPTSKKTKKSNNK